MKNYKINALQFHVVPVLLNTTQQDLCKIMGCTTNYMSRHINDGEFKLSEVLALCNKFHVRLSSFITTDDDPNVTASLVVGNDEWRAIEFKEVLLKKRLKLEGINFTRMMHVMKVSRKFLDGITEHDVPLKKLVSLCNAFGLNMCDFITDATLPRITSSLQDVRAENERLRQEVSDLREEVYRLKRQLSKRPYECQSDVMPYMHAAED